MAVINMLCTYYWHRHTFGTELEYLSEAHVKANANSFLCLQPFVFFLQGPLEQISLVPKCCIRAVVKEKSISISKSIYIYKVYLRLGVKNQLHSISNIVLSRILIAKTLYVKCI